MSTDLPPLTDMKPRLVTTLLGDPGGRVMQSFVRAPWSGDYYEATVDSVVSGQASNLRISRCGADGTMLDYAVLEGAGHGAAITAEYDAGQVWIWLFWGSDVGHPTGTAVRWAYNGTPNGARVLLADAETVPDPGAGDPGHINGYFAIDQAKDRIATKFSSGTTETYTLWKLSDYKAGTGSPLFTAPTTWPTGDLSAFQGFTTSDKSLYITRGGSQPSDQAPTLYELDWATGVITNTLDISQLAATTSAGPDGGHNEAEGVCLWRDSGGNPELLFGIDTGPTSNRRGLVFRLAAPVDGTKTKTVQIDAERVIDGPATNVVAAFSYDRTVRYTTGGFTPAGYADPVKLSEQSTAVLSVSDHQDLTDDSYGFVIHAKLSWDDAADPGRRKTATYTAQLSAADPAVVNLSQALVATGAVAPGQVIAGAPGHSPVVTMVGDQVAVDGVVQGEHLTADATAAQQAAAQSAQAAAASAALVGAPAGTAIDAHLGGDSTGLVAAVASNANMRTHVTVGATGADFQTITDALNAYPNGNVAIELQSGNIAHATTYMATSQQANVSIYGQGREATTVVCSGGFINAPMNADQWRIHDFYIMHATGPNTDDCIVSDYPRRWNTENCKITGFGGNSIWYRGGLGSSTRRNYIIAKDSTNTNGGCGIRVDLSSTGVFATTYITEQDHVASSNGYGFYFNNVNHGSTYIAPIAEYAQTNGMYFNSSMGALINPYTENNAGTPIVINDSLMTVIGPRESPVYTWSAVQASERHPMVVGRNFINPGKAIIYAPTTGSSSDPTVYPSIRWGVGNPEQQQTGVKGSIWVNVDDTLGFASAYVKTTGTGNVGWWPLVTPQASNSALASATTSTNNRGKFAGLMVWDTYRHRPVWASGPNATDVWVYADGTTAYTPS